MAELGYPNVNPVTGEPYPEQMVPRGDYARVLAEFWADGPHSETPPGHWFVLLNEVGDSPWARRSGSVATGPVVEALEWDVKSYFALGGGMHDAAIAAWSVKGLVRLRSARYPRFAGWRRTGSGRTPISRGFHPQGLELVPGVGGDAHRGVHGAPAGGTRTSWGEDGVNLGKIAARCWRGPDYIFDPATSTAGCGWILVGELVAVPTAHLRESELRRVRLGSFDLQSGGGGDPHRADRIALVSRRGSASSRRRATTFWSSRTARPRTFDCNGRRTFDASDQCSLSRIWGGIHPPCDDVPGRLMGSIIGPQAWALATEHFGESRRWPVREDLDGNGTVGGGDVGNHARRTGDATGDCAADLNEDGLVNGADLGLLIRRVELGLLKQQIPHGPDRAIRRRSGRRPPRDD